MAIGICHKIKYWILNQNVVKNAKKSTGVQKISDFISFLNNYEFFQNFN